MLFVVELFVRHIKTNQVIPLQWLTDGVKRKQDTRKAVSIALAVLTRTFVSTPATHTMNISPVIVAVLMMHAGKSVDWGDEQSTLFLFIEASAMSVADGNSTDLALAPRASTLCYFCSTCPRPSYPSSPHVSQVSS